MEQEVQPQIEVYVYGEGVMESLTNDNNTGNKYANFYKLWLGHISTCIKRYNIEKYVQS